MRKSFFGLVLYFFLTAGAVTMIFPFIWMLVTSFKSSLEVLSAQITLVPELKKYIPVGKELEPVEFQLALQLEKELSDFEGKLNSRVPSKNNFSPGFGSEATNTFSRYRESLKRIFTRYLSHAEVKVKVEELRRSFHGRLIQLLAEYRIPPSMSREIEKELRLSHHRVQALTETAVYSESSLSVIVLAGERRGEEYAVAVKDLKWRRFLWSNYRKAWEAAPFARYFINSIFMSLAVSIGQVVTSALAAYAFARMRFRFQETLFMILLGTMMVPKQVILIPDYAIISGLRWIDTYYALIVPFAAAVFGIYFMRQHFATLPQDLFDAASIDGCGRLRTLLQIVLPLSRSVITTVFLFTFIMTWNSLLWPLVMTNTPEMRPLQVGLAIFNQESGTDWELLMAASTFSIAPLLLVFFIAQKQFIEGITRSGMKD